MCAADLRSQSDERITDEEIDRAWEEHLREVWAVQEEQIRVLDHLVQHDGLRWVYVEGSKDRDVAARDARLTAVLPFIR